MQTEYNTLAVTPSEHRDTTLGYISLFLFERALTGLHLLMTEIHSHASPAIFSLRRLKPETARFDSDLTVAVSAVWSQNNQAKIYFIVARPAAGFEKQEYSFHLLNLHKKKICRAYNLLASIKLTEK